MCKISGGGACEEWNEFNRNAKAYLRCDSCWRLIRPGHDYRHIEWSFEGYPGEADQCFNCVAVAAIFADSHGMVPNPETLHETLSECADEGDEDSKKWGRVASLLWASIQRNGEQQYRPGGSGWHKKPVPELRGSR